MSKPKEISKKQAKILAGMDKVHEKLIVFKKLINFKKCFIINLWLN